jgi:DNA-binding MarR family transcriptional regulator
MTARRPRTAEGDTATAVVLEIFRVNGLLLADGNRLATAEGLTAARWQVLGAVALAGRPLTVPQIARRMGLTRQAVQESVNRLLAGALVEARDNLDHRRSPLIGLTKLGSQKYTAVDQRQARWINELAAGLKIADLAVAARLLRELGDRLENNEDTAGERNSDDTPRAG